MALSDPVITGFSDNSTNIKFSDFRNEFFVNKTFTPIRCSDFYPTSNLNTVDIPNIPIFPVANSSMKLSYFKNNGKILTIKPADRIDLLVKTIKEQLVKEYDTFIVKTIQLYYNDDYEIYQNIKEENITDLVSI